MFKMFKSAFITAFCTALLMAAGVSFAKDRFFDTDIVVVGVGGAGVSAAVAAAESGARVIALEKQDIPGGSSNFAEGLFAVNTDQQRKEFIDLSAEEAFQYAMHFNRQERINTKLVRLYLKESTNTIKWLEKNGVEFEVFRMSSHEPKVWHLVKDKGNAHHGAALVQTMTEKAESLGVKIMYNTPATKLIQENGKIKGVEGVDSRGNKVIVNAKAVILATGGFPDSKEKIAEWTKFDPEKVFPSVPLNKTGDGISMAIEAGADTGNFTLMLHPGTQGPGMRPLGSLMAMSWEPNLWVNKYGERFTDETIVHNFSVAGNAIEGQRDSFIWAIFDEKGIKYVEEKGVETGIGVLVPVTTKLTDIRDEIKSALAAGNTSIAEGSTIEELAKKINVEPKVLRATVDKYNAVKEKNYDEDFVRDPSSIKPITKGKFYALRVQPFFFVSLGGVKINENMEATDKNDKAIKGLYVTGCDAAGLYSDTYTLWTSGSAYSFAATSGRLAGTHAAEFIKQGK